MCDFTIFKGILPSWNLFSGVPLTDELVIPAAEVLFQPKIEHDEKIPAAHLANF
jgi:hypothetical protein